MKKEINHLIGKDVVYETASIVRDLMSKVDNLADKLDRVNELALGTRRDDEMREKLFYIYKNTELSQEFLSNEYVALSNCKKLDKLRLLVCGFYGAKNVGDELMLEAILKLIPNDKFDVTIMLSNNYELDASEYVPYRVLHYPKRSSDIAVIAEKFDVVVWGGGAMLDDKDYEYRGQYSTMTYILMSITRAVLKSGGHALVYGVSSNKELHDDAFLDDLAFIVKNADYFSLRDKNSLQSLKRSGIGVGKIKIINDLSIYNLKGETMIDKEEDKELNIGLNLIIDDEKMKDCEDIISHLSRYFKKPVRFTLIPFYSYQKHDQLLLEQLVSSLGSGVHCDIVRQPDNTKELLEVLGMCDYVFAMRYHAILVSALMHKRVVMIDYQKSHHHYANKNNYIRTRYLPKLLSIDYNELCRKGLPEDLIIPESEIDAEQIAVWADDIKYAIEDSLKAIKGKNESF